MMFLDLEFPARLLCRKCSGNLGIDGIDDPGKADVMAVIVRHWTQKHGDGCGYIRWNGSWKRLGWKPVETVAAETIELFSLDEDDGSLGLLRLSDGGDRGQGGRLAGKWSPHSGFAFHLPSRSVGGRDGRKTPDICGGIGDMFGTAIFGGAILPATGVGVGRGGGDPRMGNDADGVAVTLRKQLPHLFQGTVQHEDVVLGQ